MRTPSPAAVVPAIYLNGVLVTNVVSYEAGPRGYVVIELKDDDGSERVTRTGNVELKHIPSSFVPHEYAGVPV